MEFLGSGAGLSGPDLIEDVCTQLAETLRDHPDLRSSDSHERYSARVEVQLRLHDVDEKTIERAIVVGHPDSDGVHRSITVAIHAATPREVRERIGVSTPSLERPTSLDEQSVQPPVSRRRWYAPRSTNTTIK